MELRKKIKRVMSKEQLDNLEKRKVIIHSKKINPKGYYDVEYTQYSMLSYEQIVVKLIRKKYSVDDELAIQRKYKKCVNSEEFDEYDAYVENCKLEAKQFIIERDAILK